MTAISRFVWFLSRLEQVKDELADMKKSQIDQARQTHKVCVVLSGNDVRFWPRNEMRCFVDTCYKAFGVRVGYFDLQVRNVGIFSTHGIFEEMFRYPYFT